MLVGNFQGADDGTFVYKGDTRDDIYIQQGMTYEEYDWRACNIMNVHTKGATFTYILPCDEMTQQPLRC